MPARSAEEKIYTHSERFFRLLLAASNAAQTTDNPPSLKALSVADIMTDLDRDQNGCIQ